MTLRTVIVTAIIALALALLALGAPHLHVDATAHECVHHEAVEPAHPSAPHPSVEPPVEPCVQCRVQSTRLAVPSRPVTRAEIAALPGRLSAPLQAVVHPSLLRAPTGPRGPPPSLSGPA